MTPSVRALLVALAAVTAAATLAPAAGEEDALDVRFRKERELSEHGTPFLPHRGNYLLPASYNTTPNRDYDPVTGRTTENGEVKYQLSLKTPLLRKTIARHVSERTRLYFAYTQQSFWQLWTTQDSSPFRETNYEPEVFIDYLPAPLPGLGRAMRLLRLGIAHQSNGQSDPLSRSWNRIQGEVLFGTGSFVWGLRGWSRLNWFEDTDDNPRIEDYVGRAEISGRYVFGERGSLGVFLRDNLRRENRGSAQVDLSYAPEFFASTAIYVQYFLGYGENLLDHDRRNHRLSAGVKLIDWL